LNNVSLESWRTRHDALRQRFENAALSAAQLLAPKATRVTLKSAHLETREDVEEWLAETREEILQNLENGPVII
jgi:hypothetical protein